MNPDNVLAIANLIQVAQYLGCDAQYDDNGQIVIYTGVATDSDGNVVEFTIDDED
jgi:hypothetical protein